MEKVELFCKRDTNVAMCEEQLFYKTELYNASIKVLRHNKVKSQVDHSDNFGDASRKLLKISCATVLFAYSYGARDARDTGTYAQQLSGVGRTRKIAKFLDTK